METILSPEFDKISAALAIAQAHFEIAEKDSSSNAYPGHKFSSLTAINAACKTGLSLAKIAVVQLPEVNENVLVMTTILLCEGQWIKNVLKVRIDRNTIHGVGSAITYARRYSLQSILGVAADVEDDGNKSVEESRQSHSQKSETSDNGKVDKVFEARKGAIMKWLATKNVGTNWDYTKLVDKMWGKPENKYEALFNEVYPNTFKISDAP